MTVSTPRASTGRFGSNYADTELVEAVGRVLRAADPDDPAGVSTRRFDDARGPADEPDCPTARQACSRLKLSWPRLKELALGEGRSVEITLGKSAGAPKTENLSERHATFGLRTLAARGPASASPSPQRYDVLRAEALADARRSGTEELWAELLPNSNQILNLFDWDWNVALQAAGLPPRAKVTPAGEGATASVLRSQGVPVPQAIMVFVIAHGAWPSLTVMRRYMRDAGVTMARPSERWLSDCESAEALLIAEGHAVPPAEAKITGPDASLTPPPPGAFPDSATPKGKKEHEQKCVDAVARWLLGSPKPAKETRAAYLGFCVGKPDFPSPKVFDRHGGWSAILKQARAQMRVMRAA